MGLAFSPSSATTLLHINYAWRFVFWANTISFLGKYTLYFLNYMFSNIKHFINCANTCIYLDKCKFDRECDVYEVRKAPEAQSGPVSPFPPPWLVITAQISWLIFMYFHHTWNIFLKSLKDILVAGHYCPKLSPDIHVLQQILNLQRKCWLVFTFQISRLIHLYSSYICF